MTELPSGQSAQATAAEIRLRLLNRQALVVPGATAGDCDVVLRTSGSTHRSKSVGHSFDAVDWAARTARDVLGDTGWRWLVVLPPTSTGGFMTVARSLPVPLVWPGAGARFDAEQFLDWYPGGAQATSLVSTHVARLLGLAHGRAFLQSLECVLVGGGPFPESLRARCLDLGIRAVATYGATETLGGCVYDGLPWPGVSVELVDGQILIDGPHVAATYVPGPRIAHPWPTGDLAVLQDGRLRVLGREDDQVPVKGVNRFLADFEREAMSTPGVVEAVAIAVPDGTDGYRVEVFVEDATQVLPRLTTGKPDRQELFRRASGQRRRMD